MRIICVYAPNKPCERLLVFKELCAYIERNELVILLGNFNCVFSAADLLGSVVVESKIAVFLKENVETYFLQDVAQFAKRGMTRHYTHFQGCSRATLDRAYVSLERAAICVNYTVEPVIVSDHCVLIFTLGNNSISKSKFSWHLWKRNEKLLNDDICVAETK